MLDWIISTVPVVCLALTAYCLYRALTTKGDIERSR